MSPSLLYPGFSLARHAVLESRGSSLRFLQSLQQSPLSRPVAEWRRCKQPRGALLYMSIFMCTYASLYIYICTRASTYYVQEYICMHLLYLPLYIPLYKHRCRVLKVPPADFASTEAPNRHGATSAGPRRGGQKPSGSAKPSSGGVAKSWLPWSRLYGPLVGGPQQIRNHCKPSIHHLQNRGVYFGSLARSLSSHTTGGSQEVAA